MRLSSQKMLSGLAAATFAASIFTAGCAMHARVYDPYYRDYHPWGGEVSYYSQWEGETHRPHVEYNHRNADDQKAYWNWRHDHGDHH